MLNLEEELKRIAKNGTVRITIGACSKHYHMSCFDSKGSINNSPIRLEIKGVSMTDMLNKAKVMVE